MTVRAVFIHPESGIHDIAVGEMKSVESLKELLREHNCTILFVEEVKDL